MSVQENKALARRVFDEIWSGGNLDLADEVLTPDFEGHPPGGMGAPFRGPEGAKEFVGRLREAFPDITFALEDMAAEGDLVATRWVFEGTNDGDFMGIEATGRPVTAAGLTIFRIEDGRIASGWTQLDLVGMLRQLGAMPEPARI